MGKWRSAEEREPVVEEYERSGQGKREFCRAREMAVTTLDAWRRRLRGGVRLVRVKVSGREAGGSFPLSLANGRRIESGWGFGAADLARLIRVAESA